MTLHPPPLRDRDHNSHVWGKWYEELWKNNTCGVNRSYRSGDEDATIDFNNGMASVKLEYLSNLSIRQFTANERIRIEKTSDGSDDFDSTSQGWLLRVDSTWDYSTWSLGSKSCYSILANVSNYINDTTPEIAGIESFIGCTAATSKAGVYGFETSLLKTAPCVTANTFIGIDSGLNSSVDPGSNPIHGCGYRAISQGSGAVKQHTAYYVEGTAGWSYGFLFYHTDGATVVASIDCNGMGYFLQGVTVAGDIGSGYAGQLRLTNAYTGYVDGTGQTAPYGVTGATAPGFEGWLKAYVGALTVYIPLYISI